MFVYFKKIFEKIRYHKQIKKPGTIDLDIIYKIPNMSLDDLIELREQRTRLMYLIKYNEKYIKTIKIELTFIKKRICLLQLSERQQTEESIQECYYN